MFLIKNERMNQHKVGAFLLIMFTLFVAMSWMVPAVAQARRYDNRTYFQRHPYQKTGLIGAGAGAVAGGVLFGDKHRGRNAVRGAALGGAAGLGYQYLKKRGTIR